MSDTSPSLPPTGVQVLDFGHYMAGPAVGMMLADFGADVVSITPPDGPHWKHPTSHILNRNKRVLPLDLTTDGGRKTARDLARRADVVIENFRPGVMDRLGLGPDKLRAVNTGLVYLSLPGFASTDTERRDLRAFEGIISAASGQFTDMGLNRVLMGINPSYSPLPLASAYGAVLGAGAVMLALFHRERSGLGDHIEVPLASALMEGLAYNSQRVQDYPERYKSPREQEIERREAAGLPMDLSYEDLQEFLDPFYRSYPCADGRRFYVVSASHTDHAKRTLKALGVWEEMQAAGIPEVDDWYQRKAGWPSDCALGAYPLNRHWAGIVSKAMAQAFLQKTAFDWEQVFGDKRVPGRAHRTTQEWLHEDHAEQSGLINLREDPVLGKLRSIGPLGWLTDTAGEAAAQKPPKACTFDDIDWQVRKAEAATPKAGKGWLSGINILDMTNVIAGPTIASWLSRFGAEVIKLDPVKSTFDPWNTIVFGMQAGRGKKSLLADIKSPEGHEIFHRLLQWADIITINAVDRQVKWLGLDEASLAEINPRAILCQVDAFGGPRQGPMSDHLGYDDTVQAATGVMIRFGGSRQTPEEHAHFGTIDVLGGYCAAMSAAAALLRREKTGLAARARGSLMAAGELIQLPFIYDHPGRAAFDEPSGREVLGDGAHYRFYRARNGWFFLACSGAAELSKLANLPGFAGFGEAQDKVVFLENRFVKRDLGYWLKALSALDIGAVEPDSIADLRDRYISTEAQMTVAEQGSYQFVRHDIKGANRWVELFAPCAIRPTSGGIKACPPAEKYGASSREILLSLGYSRPQIDNLIAKGVVSTAWSKDYLPE
jgi:crotonobetainyl-CoA:carnitine CoA-transferase CaiB-like acyl-CoA transferase